MARVLLLGYDPETVDFSDPALPPGMTAEKVHAGIAVAMRQFAERGWDADLGLIRRDETERQQHFERHLTFGFKLSGPVNDSHPAARNLFQNDMARNL